MKLALQSLAIRHKISLLMLLISVTVLSASSYFLFRNHVQNLELAALESARSKAKVIGASLETALLFNDRHTATSSLKLLVENSQVEYSAVLLPDQHLFAEYGDASHGFELETSQEKLVEDGVTHSAALGDEHIWVRESILDRGDVIGTLLVHVSIEPLQQQREKSLHILLFCIILGVVLAGVLARMLQQVITEPLSRIVDLVNNVSVTSNYDQHLDVTSQDEVGVLARGFNHMLEEVRVREQRLKDHSDHLQLIVDKRTEQLYEKAHYDELTKLPNRYLLQDRLEHAIETGRRKEASIAVLFMDLDRFKTINDSLGHNVGDQLLRAVAERLLTVARVVDTVARLGGDEFVFLLEDIQHPEDAARIAQRIIKTFEQPFDLKNNTLHMSTSIGISVFPDDGSSAQMLLKNADVSMYHSKQKGPGHYSFYIEEMNQSSFHRLAIENHMRSAIANDEFKLVYQPQVDLESGAINRAEALLRWNNSELGFVSPAEFIPIAEEIGYIHQIGLWVISQAFHQMQNWDEQGLPQMCLGVNISASHILEAGLISHIMEEATRCGISTSRLELEITEDVFLDHSAKTLSVLSQLQAIGVKIAIDDFGTGYSSLQYLKTLPVDCLKLDGMFVKDLQENAASRGIASSTIILAHSLNMKLIAECVETEEQLAFLMQEGCDLVQGYYLHKPLEAERFGQLLAENAVI